MKYREFLDYVKTHQDCFQKHEQKEKILQHKYENWVRVKDKDYKKNSDNG